MEFDVFKLLKNSMMSNSAFFCLCMFITNYVLSDNSDELKTVLEGDSVTLQSNVTELPKDDHILWKFGPRNARIAEIIKRDQINFIWVSNDEIFRDKLQLNNQTGSLTLKNIRITHSGLYQLEIINSAGTSVKRFSVTVYSPLPVPAITNNSSVCSSSSSERSSLSKCVLVCSVVNVTQVTLSWYKGNSLFSSISVSDLNSSLSLLLEVEYQENNIYSCVINNPIRNQTKHLNITEVCQTCSAAVVPVFISTCVICCGCRKCRKQGQEDQTIKVTEYTQIIYYSLQMTDLSQKSYEDVNRTVNAVTYQHTTQ
ncbi:hepatocyte cell adhesion molecule-like isoform X2 [Myxocyprinus asiaticus]|uniref:hepatocyte cell adhesion molecule-like isoform X2 n=1 Tax=Myxocyprinus asiaticus TaxID=70543 RepID=UPI002222D3B5|nr:hepatocyte cell adhesion molecule-like isoform X2 [Myxocyprinus asiaticus]